MPDIPQIEEAIRAANGRLLSALGLYGSTLASQAGRQGTGDAQDYGRRREVTGGKQMDGFIAIFRDALLSIGLPASSVITQPRGKLHLPGYFRATKMWDLLIIHNGMLLAAIEAKSIASSFGNNMNNRAEEAVGNGKDIEVAFREGAVPSPTVPWTGYFFLLPDVPGTREPVSVSEPHFPVLPAFKDASYARRAEELCIRLVREKLYHCACLILASGLGTSAVLPRFPRTELSFDHFLRSLLAHCYAGIRA